MLKERIEGDKIYWPSGSSFGHTTEETLAHIDRLLILVNTLEIAQCKQKQGIVPHVPK